MRSLIWHILLGGLFLASNLTSVAATHLVEIRDYYFTPTNLHIAVGDTVMWTNAAGQTHDATNPERIWASANMEAHATYSYTFTNLGTFPYICQRHIFMHPEQTGQVIVAEASLPPPITITNPPDNARFLAPASFPVSVSVTNGVTLTNVQFFQNGVLFADIPFPPFQGFAEDLAAGNYTFVARALDDLGVASTSAPVAIQVLTNARLSGPIRAGDSFQFAVNAISGQTYIAEFSTNLLDWQPFATNTAAGAALNFTNSAATQDSGFYRVWQDGP